MNETIKEWLWNMYKAEMEEVRGTISNERLWEKGYDGEEPNPHTENINLQLRYLAVLEEKMNEIR